MSYSRGVAILGAGPSGLLAVHAAIRADFVVHLYTASDRNDRKSPWKSQINGCQYLHAPIPGVDVRSTEVEYRLWGSADVYRRRVYGPEIDVEVSPESLEGTSRAWDLRSAYDILWDRYITRQHKYVRVIPEFQLGPYDVDYFRSAYPHIISTIPAPALCGKSYEHTFTSARVWAMGDAPVIGQTVPVEIGDNKVICNGLPAGEGPLWYRAAKVFGYSTVEWSGSLRGRKAVAVDKPIESSCNCHTGVERMGRYGEWRKGILTSDVFNKAERFFQERR